jgi:subtilisin family serine protease
MASNTFEGGKVIAALRYIPGYAYPADFFTQALKGLDYCRTEIIFPAGNSENGMGKIILVHLECNKKETAQKAVEMLLTNPYVLHAEVNTTFERHIIPNDPYFERLWGMRAIHAPRGWDITVGNKAVIVGVIDSGVDITHPDIRDNIWAKPNETQGWNFVTNSDDVTDFTGHGTHIAGTVGAVGNNHIGVAGVCWQVGIAPMKIGDAAFDLAAAVASIDYARVHDIPILNISWGGRYDSPILKYVIGQYNGLLVVSAGNSGMDIDNYPEYPASYDFDNIITVAASDPDGKLASYSNYGTKHADIAAPGTDIYSLDPMGGYSNAWGTSMAAPHVAGAAALLKSYNPNLTALEMKRLIMETAYPQPSMAGKIVSGGVLDVGALMERVSL